MQRHTEMLRVRSELDDHQAPFSMISLHLFLLLLQWEQVNTETTSSPVVLNQPVTPRRSILSKGQNVVLLEVVEILKPTNIELLCNLTDVPTQPQNISGYWKKDGLEILNSHHTVLRENAQYFLIRTFNIQAVDLGNYSCVFSYKENEEEATFILKVPDMKEKRDKPIVSYVGDSVVLSCKTKHVPNTWEWYRTNSTGKELINATAEPLNYKIVMKENVTKLTLKNVTEEDSGRYVCSAVYDIGPSESHVELKVLSFMEPLKPFLAIAAEVLILVILILLYERQNQQPSHNTITDNGVNVEQTSKLTQEENNGLEDKNAARQRKV